jgi:N6-L-threonylcarbamoyladenine synthase
MLSQQLLARSPVPVTIPPPHLCTDNAAMVAACGYYHFQAGKTSGYDLDVVPSLSLG